MNFLVEGEPEVRGPQPVVEVAQRPASLLQASGSQSPSETEMAAEGSMANEAKVKTKQACWEARLSGMGNDALLYAPGLFAVGGSGVGSLSVTGAAGRMITPTGMAAFSMFSSWLTVTN